MPLLLASGERDPMRLFERVITLRGVHMHGPEHHMIVPCVLLTAYHNCTDRPGLEQSLKEAVERARKVPGGACGNWGVCGAAVGAGIFASVALGSNPLNAQAWPLPQSLTALCLEAIAKHGGPRCCKRTGRIAVETAAAFCSERLGVTMPLSRGSCAHSKYNRECLRVRCPYFPEKDAPDEEPHN